MKDLLTIVIPTTIDRREMFNKLVEELYHQIDQNHLYEEVTIEAMEDNKEMSVGKKRQLLLEKATGKYIIGFDSDDWPAPTYVIDIITALKENPEVDHVGFIERCNIDGEISKSIFSIKYDKWSEGTDGWDHIRCANPKSVIKREIALMVGYPDLRYGEDRIFSEAVTPLLTSEIFIEKELYYYNYISTPEIDRYGLNRNETPNN